MEKLRQARALVIVAAPGAGKTTRVPPAILRAGLLGGDHPNLVMLQPRRVAARAAAQRIADENGWEIGGEVGYHIRFEKKISQRTRLRVLTEGILTRQLLADPFLAGVGAVVLDEFHERSLNSDLAVAMLREMQQTVRGDLLIIIMSATLEAQAASRFLGNCPILNVPGRTFPVEIEYLDHSNLPVVGRVVAAISREIENADPQSRGDVLVFLPGAQEISRTMNQLESLADKFDLAVLPLHGSLPPEQQALALRPSPRRKVILATNIAETSLTIDGVTLVIDGGLARVPQFDARRGLNRLELVRISKASAAQRAGRAGRTAPGKCVRLWSAKEQAGLDEFESPEIQRVDLCGTVLDLHAWGKPNPADFDWFEPPPGEHLASAERLLEMLGAIDAKQPTEVGSRLMNLPLHPRLGRLLLAAGDAGCAEEGAALAALLSEKDILRPDFSQPRHLAGPKTQGDSDLLIRLDILQSPNASRDRDELDSSVLWQVQKARDELRRLAKPLGSAKPQVPSHMLLLKLLLLAYPDRVCRRRVNDPAAGIMVDGSGVRLAPESVVRQAEFFLALDAQHNPRSQTCEAEVRIASAIEVDWLFELFPQSIVRERTVVFDQQRQRVVGRGLTRYRELILTEDRDAPLDAEAAGEKLAEELRPRAMEIFGADENAAMTLARVGLLRRHMPEHPWPEFGAEQLGEIISQLCRGKKSVEEVHRVNLAEAIEASLQYPLNRFLLEHAPESIEVPTGNRIRLSYTSGQSPVLAVRLQEIFGWIDTPRIAAGRVPVLMHLLGPNYRPVQITSDLRSFWSTTYFQVRKDLRVKYPKHSWPDDPLTATPQAKGRPRQK
ncbi:MAG: ATP-dependent helicase HrpB [Planctomycetota bacterium]|nr:ATP-dependent helicase HrpB [Planctomycetota bacterium]